MTGFRNHKWYKLLDEEGIPVTGGSVWLYEIIPSGSSPLNLFDADGNTLSQPLTTDSQGIFEFYVKDYILDSSTGYTWDTQFIISWSKDDKSGLISGDHLWGEFQSVNPSGNFGRKNKAISDFFGWTFETHADAKFGSVEGCGSSSSSSSSVSSSSSSLSSSSSSSTSISSSSTSSSSSSSTVPLTGTLTHIDSDFQGFSNYDKVHGDANFIYVACSFDGIRSYSVDGSGNLTFIDNVAATVGEPVPAGNGFTNIWSDGTFIYCTRSVSGISSYSVDGSGNLTHVSHDDQGGNYRDVWGDGNFVYAVAYTTNAIRSYSVNVSGGLTHVDADSTLLGYNSVWGDGNFIYVATTSGLRSYSVDGSGNLTFVDLDYQGVTEPYVDVWGDGNFIYVACEADGIRSYSVDGSGNLTFKDADYQGSDDYNGVWGDGNFIYSACDNNAGLRSYSVS